MIVVDILSLLHPELVGHLVHVGQVVREVGEGAVE